MRTDSPPRSHQRLSDSRENAETAALKQPVRADSARVHWNRDEEPLGFFEWQRAQEKVVGVKLTEDGSIQADPERESHDSNRCKYGQFAELSQRETEFVHDRSQLKSFFVILCVERRSDPHAWRGLRVPGTRARRRWPKPRW